MRFGVLGRLEVSGQDGPLSLGGPKQRLVLAHLVLGANKVVSAEHLIDAVWGEDLPVDPRSTVQTYVSRLRSVLGSEGIEARAPGYLLRAEREDVDVLRFEDLLAEARGNGSEPRETDLILTEALGLWRGPALADLADEPSLEGEISRLEELRLQALEEKFDAGLDLGHHASVVADLESLTRSQPLRERLWGEFMLALYRCDRQAEALAAFERARSILSEELGIDPSVDLRHLHERILRQDPDLQLKGEPLRGYRLLEQIGEGAFGVVYRAIQPQVHRDVAIKAVHPHLANHPDFIRIFESEAQFVARLEHPHVVPLYDYWREPGGAYLVMRFLRGGNLAEALADGPLELERVARLLDQICEALATAHRQGVVHRNVKPSNILLDEEGNAYLADFGIAMDVVASARTQPGAVNGSVPYLAPEQIRGETITARTDVFALGVVLYEVLVGQHPLHSVPDLAVYEHQLREPLPPARKYRKDLPPGVDDVIATATAKDPRHRFNDPLSLAGAFRNALPTASVTVATAPPVEARNPYKGLRPFMEADADDFYGREAFVDRLLKRWRGSGPQGRFLAVVGPSGSGKSSAVRAGFLPALRRGGLEGSEGWFISDLVPGRHPMEELEAALLRVASEPTPGLLQVLETGPRGLLQAVDHVIPRDSELVLIVDQFEEVFTLTEDEAERSLLLESLRVAAADPTSRVRIALTLRADFYDRPLIYPRFGELLGACTEVVTPLAPDELERAIVRPASSVSQTVETALVAQVASDVAEQPGALPLVQYALTELFDRRQDGRLTLDAYREIGGVGGALAASAEHLFATRQLSGRDAVRELFLSLVTLGEGTPDTRRRVRLSELSRRETDPAAMESALDAYGRHRLLTFDRDPGTREPTVEAAHEALLGAWERLRGWIDEARDDIRVRNTLASAVADWEASGRDESFLLRGARLERVVTWAETTTVSPSVREAEFLRASVERRDQERAAEAARQEHERALERRSIRRLRGIVAAVTVAALVASVLTAVAVDQRGDARNAAAAARNAETAQLAQRLGAQALVEEDLDLALLLARQAVAIDDSPQTRGYLLAALRSSPSAIGIMHGTGLLKTTAISPDGKTLAVIGETDGLLLFDTGTYRQIGNPLPVCCRLESVAYSPDGRTLAVGGGDTLRLLDAGTYELLAKANVNAWRMAFTNDGARLVVLHEGGAGEAAADATITIRDAATLRPIGAAIEPESFEGAEIGLREAPPHFALTSDERSLLTASEDGELAVWDLRSGEKTRTLRIATGLHALALSPDDRTAAVGVDGGIQLVDLSSGEVRAATGSLSGRPSWLLFSRGGDTVVSTNLDGTVTLWDVGSAAPQETLRGHWNSVQQPVFSPDGETLYTVSHDGSAIAWDMTGERGLVRPFRFTSDRRSAIITAGYDGHPGEFSPDGRLIAVGLQDRGIALWDATDLTPVGPLLLATGGEVKSFAFAPDGRTLAASALGGEVTLWDVGSRTRLRHESDEDLPRLVGLDFSPDGRTLAMSTRSGVRLVDVATGAGLREIEPGEGTRGRGFRVADPTFSADGTMIATARGYTGADLWDVATGASIVTVDAPPGDQAYWFVALSPDARTLAVGGTSRLVRLVDVRTGKLLHELDLAGTGAFSLEFSPDGRTLAVSGFESVASLWDVATGTQYGPMLTAGSRRTALDLSPDGRRLLMVAGNGEGAVWDIDPESWKQRACEVANRTLTRAEWEEFLPGLPYEPACR